MSAAGASPQQAYFDLAGMHCASCAETASRLLARQPGVLGSEISFASGLGRLRFDAARTDAAAALRPLEALGYRAEVTGALESRGQAAAGDALTLRLLVTLALAMQVMALALAYLYPSYSDGRFDAAEVRAVQYLSWALTTPILFYGGRPILGGALAALRTGGATMDSLVGLGMLAAYGYSARVALVGGGEVYFDSVAMICTFTLAGRWLERLGGARARQEVRALLALQPATALRREGGAWREVPTSRLRAKEVILARPGERLAADARVLDGEAALDESLLTGEALPVARKPGDAVQAGTSVIEGRLICEVTQPAAQSRLAAISALVESTLAQKPPIRRLADMLAARFALFVLALALAVLAWRWAAGASVGSALLPAVAVLVAACPCALGLATPLALSIATGQAARRGIFMRAPAALEAAAGIDRIVFDKTGTLTLPEHGVTLLPAPGISRGALLRMSAALARHSAHPLARTLAALCPNDDLPKVRALHSRPGRGVEGVLPEGRVRIGSLSFVAARPPAGLRRTAARHAMRGESIAWVACDQRIVGLLASAARISPSAYPMREGLAALGIEGVILSGDSQRSATAAAVALGLAGARGRVTPEGKARRVRAWQARGVRVAMVGDGSNDAPALAQADLSIALHRGAGIAGATAELLLTRDDLSAIPWVLALARRSRRTIRQNLAWAFAYNLVALPLAASGQLSPIFAAGAMAASSLLVIANSLRLGRGTGPGNA